MKYTVLTQVMTTEEATNLLQALAPLLDACSKIEPLPSALAKAKHKWGFEFERWDLWTFANAVARQAGLDYEFFRVGRTCGALTQKGKRCRRKVRWGRSRCNSHINPAELDQARQWQERVHLPFPRITNEDVEKHGIAYWDRMALEQKRHVELQRREASRIARDLGRVLSGLENGVAPKTYLRTKPDPQPQTEPLDF